MRSTTTSWRLRSSPGVPVTCTRKRSSLRIGARVASHSSRRIAIAGLALTTLIALFALVQRSNAREDARDARARQFDAVAVSLLPTDPEVSLLLARDSADLSPTATAEEVLRQTLGASRVRTVVDVGRPLLGAAAPPGRIVSAAADGSVIVKASGSTRTVATGTVAVDVSIATGGDVLLTGSDGRLRLVSGGSVRLVPSIQGALGADVSDDASLALVRAAGATAQLVDVASGETRIARRPRLSCDRRSHQRRGRLLATGGVDRVVRIWRASDGKLLTVLEGHVGQITAIAFSRRGTLIATASTDGVGRVWRVGSGEPVTVLSGHGNFLTDVAFSPDGTQVVTASRDRTARTWKAETGAALAVFTGDTEEVDICPLHRSRPGCGDREPRRHGEDMGCRRPAGSAPRRGSRCPGHQPRLRRRRNGARGNRRASPLPNRPAGRARPASSASRRRPTRSSTGPGDDAPSSTETQPRSRSRTDRRSGSRATAPGSPRSRSPTTGSASSPRAPITIRGSGIRRAASCSRFCAVTSRSSPARASARTAAGSSPPAPVRPASGALRAAASSSSCRGTRGSFCPSHSPLTDGALRPAARTAPYVPIDVTSAGASKSSSHSPTSVSRRPGVS